MFLFGHIGLTLGAAVLGSGACTVLQQRCQRTPKAAPEQVCGQPEPAATPCAFSPAAWTAKLSAFLDIRLLLAGSMLPDIIDKPVGHYFFDSTFHNGRIFSHTLLFLVVLLVAGLLLYGKMGKSWLLALAAGVLAHLMLDSMWLTPQTFWWPLHGWRFPTMDDSNIIGDWLTTLFTDPWSYITEVAGLAILVLYGTWLLRTRKTRRISIP